MEKINVLKKAISKLPLYVLIFLIPLILMTVGCNRDFNINQEVRFVNDSSETIYIVPMTSTATQLRPSLGIGTDEYPLIKLEPKEYYISDIMVGPDYDRSNKHKLFQYLVFTEDTINSYPLEDIIKADYFDDLLMYTFEELKKLKFVVRFVN